MMEIGRICVKLAGRDAGKKCVVVDNIDDKHVLIDGQTRRRKCNIAHLEPLNQNAKIKKGASTSEVKKALQALKIEVKETKPKKTPPRPKKFKVKKEFKKKAEEKPKTKKAETKETTQPKAAAKKTSENKKENAKKQAKPVKKETKS